jgi:hypothetical protein
MMEDWNGGVFPGFPTPLGTPRATSGGQGSRRCSARPVLCRPSRAQGSGYRWAPPKLCRAGNSQNSPISTRGLGAHARARLSPYLMTWYSDTLLLIS